MTRLLNDILRQPSELSKVLARLTGPEAGVLSEAAGLIARAQHVYITGIGASWAASMGMATLFEMSGRAVTHIDASELLHFAAIAPGSVIVALSRSGKSIEITELFPQIRASGARLIAITNGIDSPLTRAADLSILIETAYDHAVSVNTYSTIALAGAVLAAVVTEQWSSGLASELERAFEQAAIACSTWRESMEHSAWFSFEATTYFLARGPSLSTCHEARLLWEEAAKIPATAMSTGAFRHGPQEMIRPGVRIGLWIDPARMRDADLSVAGDLRRLGCPVMLIGQSLSHDAADLTLELPATPRDWQFVIDMIPAQLAAERLARLQGVDCDTLRLCPFIVEDESGLIYDGAQTDGAQTRIKMSDRR
ncbi:MAG TPA: SIS domain-containing protein [Bryobacteraceae bacterium]|jgi:glucosamine--fructose-6-phosphate aminotransferase (isomerizing)